VKGEIVVAIAGCDAVSAGHEEGASEVLPCLDDRLRAMMAAGSSVSDAARRVAAELGVPRRDAYRRALEMRADSQGGTP
jgi:hypothetical protein